MPEQRDIPEFYDLMKKVLLRTGMYIGKVGFDDAAIYLDGYAHGLFGHAKQNVLGTFGIWLSNHFNCESTHHWRIIINDCFPDNEVAKLETIKLFELFMKESGLS